MPTQRLHVVHSAAAVSEAFGLHTQGLTASSKVLLRGQLLVVAHRGLIAESPEPASRSALSRSNSRCLQQRLTSSELFKLLLCVIG